MKSRTWWAGMAVGIAMGMGAAVAESDTPLEADLRALDGLRQGTKTPLDDVERLGESLLKKHERPEDQAQVQYQLAHVHAQSGLTRPEQVVKYAQAALDSKLITPRQRGTLYSYLASAYEVDKREKDFANRRRKAVEPLLKGLQELQGFNLPDVAPELPAVGVIRVERDDPTEVARVRAIQEAARLQRERAELTRDLVQRRDTLKSQIKYLYYREPGQDDELRELATAALGEDLANGLVETARAERERVERARRARSSSAKP